MKKTSIIAILIIFLAAILTVGFFGGDLKVYNPVIYTEEIVWNNAEYKNDKRYKVEMYDDKQAEIEGSNAKLVYTASSLGKGVTFNIKCYAKPTNADNTTLSYYMKVVDDSFFKYYEVKEDNTVNIIFYKSCSARLVVSTNDNTSIKYRIDFEITDLSDIF